MARSEAIDILKLYSEGDHKQWNQFLAICLERHDIATLTDVLRRLQMGMDNLVKQKLNTDKVGNLFLRMQRSIENTIRDIHRAKNPNQADKRRNQNELELFLRRARW